MRLVAPATLALWLAACSAGTTPTNEQGAALEAPVTGPSAYAILPAGNVDRGWDVLDALDAELPPALHARIQARGLVSGASRDVMVRFSGECARDGGFVAAVQAVAQARGVQQVRCAATLPAG